MTTLSIAQNTLSHSLNTKINVMATIQTWMDRRAQRQALAQLDQHQLNDLGITRQEALTEAKLPFWK